MDVTEVMDAFQELLDLLQEIGDTRPDDAALQRLVAKGGYAGAAGIKTLCLMLLYKDEVEPVGNGAAHP